MALVIVSADVSHDDKIPVLRTTLYMLDNIAGALCTFEVAPCKLLVLDAFLAILAPKISVVEDELVAPDSYANCLPILLIMASLQRRRNPGIRVDVNACAARRIDYAHALANPRIIRG